MGSWDEMGFGGGHSVPVAGLGEDGGGHGEPAVTQERPKLEGYRVPPIPYVEEDTPLETRKWVADYHDHLIPKRKGFISDFVFHTRGIMTPTLASIWSCLFLLQSAIKREAWLKWHPKPLYPNQYILIIGAAGKVKKTTAVTDIGWPILKKFRAYINDRNLYEMKQLTIVKDKSTPEALISAMLPESKEGGDYYLVNPDGSFMEDECGKSIRYVRTSETTIIVSELSVMLSKRSYADSMIENLLDLYDPHDEWEWRREGAGIKKLRKLCTSLIGGTTVDGFRASIPNAAKGDGFLSRTVLVYVPDSRRRYPMPFLPEGAPDADEMAKRLAWIAERTLGEFSLSYEALQIYYKWYMVFSKRMDDDPSLAGAMSRMDVNVLKTALLIRAARYDATVPVIDEGDIMDAIRIVEATYMALPYLLGQLDDDLVLSHTAKAEVFLKKAKSVQRQKFLAAMRIRSDIATLVVQEMIARGEVCVEHDGKRSLVVGGRTEETYVWIGPEDNGAGSFESIWTDESFQDTWEVWLSEERIKSARSKPHSLAAIPEGQRGRPPKLGRPSKSAAQKKKAKRRSGEVGKGESEDAAS